MQGQDLFSTGTYGGPIIWMERISFHQQTWVFVLVFALLAGLAWVRLAYGSILAQLFESGSSFQVASRIFKDNNILHKQVDNILLVSYFISASLLLFYVERRFGFFPYGLSGLGLFAFNLVFLILLALIKMLLTRLIGILFGQELLLREYFYNTQIYNKILGILIPPFMLFALYSRGILNTGIHWLMLALLAGLLVLRMFRALLFSFRKDLSKFYMFLYLCALEMAPLILLYRWLEGVL